MVTVIGSYKNLSYDNLGLSGKLYPNPDPARSDGTVVMFTEKFNTNDGLAHLVPAEWLPARELPDEQYPFVLNTGRMLEHWHTGSMTRRSYALDAIAPKPLVFVNPDDVVEREYERLEGEMRARQDSLAHLASLPTVTSDGTPIALLANATKFPDTEAALRVNAEGIGLYRTEFGFAVRAA